MSINASFAPPPLVALEGGEGKPPRLAGTLVPYGVASAPSISDGRRYRFTGPPANDASDWVAVREHDDYTPIGTVSTHTSGDAGLAVVVDLLDTTAGRDAHVEAKNGVRNGFSASFDVLASEESEDDDGAIVDVTEWTLQHVGHVRHPAFGEASEAVAASTGPEIQEPPKGKGVAMPDETVAAGTPAPTPVVPVTTAPMLRRMPTVGEYGHALLLARTGDSEAVARLARYNEAVNLAAGDTVVSGIGGIIPTPIVGPVIDARPYDRPIFSALGPFAGPSSGASWNHPVVSDPLADAVPTTELASAVDTLEITPVNVAWSAIKRSTNVSREAQIFSEPSVMGVIGDQLARAYSRGAEAGAASVLNASTGGNTAFVVALNGSDAVAKFVSGSVVIYGQTGSPADLIITNPTDYGKIAGWTATDGRPLFPMVGQLVNGGGALDGGTSYGGNIAGIPVVVSWALAAGQNFLLATDYVRSFEGNRATISVETGNFGVTAGIFGTVATAVLVAKAVTKWTISATVAREGK